MKRQCPVCLLISKLTPWLGAPSGQVHTFEPVALMGLFPFTGVWPGRAKTAGTAGSSCLSHGLSPSSESVHRLGTGRWEVHTPVCFQGVTRVTCPHCSNTENPANSSQVRLKKAQLRIQTWGDAQHLALTDTFTHMLFLTLTHPHTHISAPIYSTLKADQNHHIKAVLVPRTWTLPLSLSLPSLSLPWGSWTFLPCHPPHLRQPRDETVITHILRLHVTYQTIWIWLPGCDQILASR